MKNKQTILSETPVETSAPTEDAAVARDERSRVEAFPIVGIGASAGGLEAFTQLLKALPLDTGMGFVLVQHLDPEHESALTQILSRATSLPVSDVINDQPVQPNCVYIIPPDTNLSIARGLLKLQPRPKSRTPHRPIDSFFESLAADHGERAIGVVLSGTASDGTLGLEAIKVEGGITFAQDDSARYDSMPRSAVAAGCVDLVLSPKEIAEELARIAKHPYVAGKPLEFSDHAKEDRPETTTGVEDDPPDGGEDGYVKALSLVRTHSGVDFSLYKSGTIQRRITRRLVINKQNTLDDYAAFLQGNVKELDALCSDLLINVTSFFRNPEAFETLQREVLPELLEQPGDEPIRVWVPGCSTGQEAYSIAIALMEAAESLPRGRNIQVFATDLNEKSLEKARFGHYPKSISDDVSPERLRRFFVEEQGGYRVSKSLREMVVFARQNLFGDPPFSRMDLISCRNLLIYVGPSLQRRAIPTFHYALKPDGILFLGASESISAFTELFEPVDKKYKIYSKKAAPTPAFHMAAGHARGEWTSTERRASALSVGHPQQKDGFVNGEQSAQREADRIILNQFAPPGVLVNAELQVLQFRGSTGAFLEPPVGKASFDVLKMAREGLMLPLHAAISEARKENKTTRRENVRVMQDGEARAVHLEIIPLKNLSEMCFLILFQDVDQAGRASLPKRPARQPLSKEDETSRITELETALTETREYLQAREEQHETVNEELQAASEEIQSANEELQSVNEELETSKEELESANEELTTVNDEMSHRNVELNVLNNDLINFQNSTRLVVLLLGLDLAIRRYSPQAEKQFGLRTADVGRPISHIRHNLVHADDTNTPLDLEAFCAEVISSASEQEREVLDKAGHWHSLRARPYTTSDENVDGAVLLLLEIDELKRSEHAVSAARDYAENIVATVREPLLVLNSDLRVESANHAFYHVFQVEPAETIGKFIYHLGNHQWDIPRLRELLEEILPQKTSIEEFQVEHEFRQLGRRTMLLNARRILDPQRKTERILLAFEDITARKRAEEALLEAGALQRAIFNSANFSSIATDEKGVIQIFNVGAERMLGYSAAEVMNKLTPAAFSEPEEVIARAKTLSLEFGTPITPGFDALVFKAARGIEDVYELTNVRKDGSRFAAVVSVTALRNPQDVIIGFLLIGSDNTAHKQAEAALRQSERKFRAVLESAPDAIVIADHQGSIVLANAQTERLFGYTREELIGQRVEMLMPARFHNRHVGHRERYITQPHTREMGAGLELLGKRKDGSEFPIEVCLSTLETEQGTLVSSAVRDITERSRLEKQMQDQAAVLSDLHRRKDEFLAMLSHELRSPLAPIANAVQLLGLERASESQVQQRARGIIERQLKQLQHLVDDLLEVSRITTGRVQLRRVPITVNTIVEGAVETVRPLIEQRRQELTVSLPTEPIWLHADAARLEQVVVNLLTNAAKYTEEGGHVWLTVELANGQLSGTALVSGPAPDNSSTQPSTTPVASAIPLTGSECIIRVRDTGVGIASKLLPHVFDLFTQAERSLDRSQGGLGIGLALVQRLTELHDGTVEATSVVGEGSEFVVRLPIADLRLPNDTNEDNQQSEIENRKFLRVLVVDDDTDTALSFTMLLKRSGHDARVAHDGPTAVQVALDFRPDVVLLDIGLPGLNGYEVAKRIRQQPDFQNVVLVALTGYGQDSDRQSSLQAGFDHHLIKPASFAQLQQILAKVPVSAAMPANGSLNQHEPENTGS